jgi:hypothetical protein
MAFTRDSPQTIRKSLVHKVLTGYFNMGQHSGGNAKCLSNKDLLGHMPKQYEKRGLRMLIRFNAIKNALFGV